VSKRTCTVEGCDRPHLARGYCNTHYLRVKAHGDTEVRQVRGDDRRRLMMQVEVTADGCWLWKGALNRDGYGKTSVRREGRTHALGAHLLSFEVFVGPVPDGLQLDHLCHTHASGCAGGRTCLHRRCINPKHLEPVTGRENVLRSSAFPALNAGKIACPKGHPYDAENTRIYRGRRHCRACDRLRGAYGKRRKVAA
jgi:hypothetical protein